MKSPPTVLLPMLPALLTSAKNCWALPKFDIAVSLN